MARWGASRVVLVTLAVAGGLVGATGPTPAAASGPQEVVVSPVAEVNFASVAEPSGATGSSTSAESASFEGAGTQSASTGPVPLARNDGESATVFDRMLLGLGMETYSRVPSEKLASTPPPGLPPLSQSWSAAPADPQVAADDTYVMQAVNAKLRVSDVNGSGAMATDLRAFFQAPPDSIVFNPSLTRDFRTGRWLVAAAVVRVDNDGYLRGSVPLAISQTANPTAGYTIYDVRSVEPAAPWTRRAYWQPKLAVTDDKVVVTWNEVIDNTIVTGGGLTALPTVPLLRGTAAVGVVFPADPTRLDQVPAQSLSAGSAAYVASLDRKDSFTFDVIDGLPGVSVARTTSIVDVSPVTSPPSAGGRIQAMVPPMQTAVYRDGIWWGGTSDGCSTGDERSENGCVRMWQLAVAPGGAPTLTQEFDIVRPGRDLLYPAATIDAEGNLAVVMTQTEATSPKPGILVVGQAAGSAPNTISAPLYERVASREYTYPGTPWGSYAGATVAADGKRVWLTSPYSTGGGWTTELVALRPSNVSARPAPSRVLAAAGGSATATVTFTSRHGWSGSVPVTVSGLPAGATATVTPSSVYLVPGASAAVTVTVNVADTQAADFVMSVNGCAGGDCARADVFVAVQRFEFAVTNNSVPRIEPGSSSLSEVTVTSVHGWTGTVALDATGGTAHSSATVSPASVAVPAGGSVKANVSTQVGSGETAWNFWVYPRACAAYCRSAGINAYVSTFSLYPSQFSMSVAPGSSGTGGVIVWSQNEWAGWVTMSASVPADVGVTISPSSVYVSASAAAEPQFTVTVPPERTQSFHVALTGCRRYCKTTYVRIDVPTGG